MSIASEITRLQNAKADLKTSINAKTDSQHQIDDETIDEYADFVDSIQTGGGTPNLQDKTVTITTNGTTNITADTGYDGLDTVEVTTNVSGGTTPTKGYVVNSFDSNGYPTEITTYGYTNLSDYLFFNNSKTEGGFLYLTTVNLNNNLTGFGFATFKYCKNLENITIPSNFTSISNQAFYGCSNLLLSSLPSNITSIGDAVFPYCTSISITSFPNNLTSIGSGAFQESSVAISEIPSGVTQIKEWTFYKCPNITTINTKNVTTIGQYAFTYCSNLKKALLPNVVTMTNTSGANGQFSVCSNLKQVWIGSSIQNTLGRYTFNNASSIEKIYINLPRATVEAFTNYGRAFMNNTAKVNVIVCNDDSGWITQEEFEALVIE